MYHFSQTDWVRAPRAAPAGTALYAIGDVHGHAEALRALHAVLRAGARHEASLRHCAVHLGDYIDRGPDSRGVLQALRDGIGGGIEQVLLAGNHDQFLIELLRLHPEFDRRVVQTWYDYGGEETMQNLGIDGYGRLVAAGDMDTLSARVREALGAELVGLLDALPLVHREGDYLFVHAGVHPGMALDTQDPVDLMMIREPFLSAPEGWDHPFCVIHGHTIAKPAVLDHRIGVDAGCYKHGALCAVQIVADRARFIAVAPDPGYPWQAALAEPGSGLAWGDGAPVPD